MTDTEFRDAVKKGTLSGGYLLFGDEDFLKNRYAADMCNAVCGGQFEEFNILKGEASETSAAALEEMIAGYPMMAEKKAVLLNGFRPDGLREKELEAYLDVFSKTEDYPHTVLAVTVPSDGMDAGTLPKKPSSVYKKLASCLTPVQFDLKGQAALKKWIGAQFAKAGAEAHFDTADAMLQRCGRDMNILHGECEKLIAYALSHNQQITPATVELVCCKNEEEDAFALANAVLAGDRTGALAALQRYRDRKEEPIAVNASLGRVLTDMLHVSLLMGEGMQKGEIASAIKMHEYKCGLYMQALRGVEPARLRAVMERCLETDRLLKSTDLKYIAVERLICTIPAKRR
ncbi:MAG: DNA polymerase III subunit delta [Clostridia bacterium]|nr:DNA polymerase III subunit delta [Clostridia bacterium]